MWAQGLWHLSKARLAPGCSWWPCPDPATMGVSMAGTDPAASPGRLRFDLDPKRQVQSRPHFAGEHRSLWEEPNPGPDALPTQRPQTGLHHSEHLLESASQAPWGTPSQGKPAIRFWAPGDQLITPTPARQPRMPWAGGRTAEEPHRAQPAPRHLGSACGWCSGTALCWANGRVSWRSEHRGRGQHRPRGCKNHFALGVVQCATCMPIQWPGADSGRAEGRWPGDPVTPASGWPRDGSQVGAGQWGGNLYCNLL